MKTKFIFCLLTIVSATTQGAFAGVDVSSYSPRLNSLISVEQQARINFQWLLNEAAQDHLISKAEQQKKVEEFQIFASQVSPKVAPLLTQLLLQETHDRVSQILDSASLTWDERNAHLSSYEKGIRNVKEMNVEVARQMLFFVTELTIHRQHIYQFGIALGCPADQLLRHDLSKLSAEQFEGYARYFKGGRKEADKAGFQKAWGHHQYEEHHLARYKKEGFGPENLSDERLRNNMRETAADYLASTLERSDNSTLVDWLVTSFPKSKPHPRLLPFLAEALQDAHALYLTAEQTGDDTSIFKGLPCWSDEVAEIFQKLQAQAGN